MIEEMTSAGQVRFRWWIQDGTLRLHNISDQQLKNDYTLDAPLAYATAIQGDTTRVLLKRGGGTEQISFYLRTWLQRRSNRFLPDGRRAPGRGLEQYGNSGSAPRRRSNLLSGGRRPEHLVAGADEDEPPTVEAYWLGADIPEQLICISQENDGKLSAWRYDCGARTATLILENYEEYQGSSNKTVQYVLLSEAYALRCDPDGTTYLLDLSQKSERVFPIFPGKPEFFLDTPETPRTI